MDSFSNQLDLINLRNLREISQNSQVVNLKVVVGVQKSRKIALNKITQTLMTDRM